MSLLLILLACGPKQAAPEVAAEPETNSEAPVAEAPAEQAAPALEQPSWVAEVPAEGTLVRLLDAGAEPRETLRLSPQAEDVDSLEMRMDMDMAADMGGMPVMEMVMPSMVIVMELAVTEVGAGGEIHYTGDVIEVRVEERPGVMQGITDQLAAELQGMVGLSGQVVVTDRGEGVSADFTAPEGANEAVQQQIGSVSRSAASMAVPLPSEPVGLGARWEVLKSTESNGLLVAQRLEMTLTEREGELLTLDSTVEQGLLDPNTQLPGMPPGAEVRLLGFDSGGTGTTVVDLGSVAPASGDSALSMDLAMEIDGPEGLQVMGMQMDLAVSMVRSAAKAAAE